jgi:hypothetical protein
VRTEQEAEDAAVAAMYRAYHFAHSLEHALELERQDATVGLLHAAAKDLRQRITAELAERIARQEEKPTLPDRHALTATTRYV